MSLLAGAKMVFALLFTLALIAAAAWVARRFGMLEMRRTPQQRRLAISESLMIDPRRRLVIVRFDEKEHLLLLGPGGDVTVSSVDAKPAEPHLRAVRPLGGPGDGKGAA